MIPFYDLSVRNMKHRDDLQDAFTRVVSSGNFIGGEEVEGFESEFAAYLGVKHCVGVGNGLDALRLALISAGVEPGSEVVVPAQTFIATWLAVTQIGAIPRPVDICENSANINPSLVQEAINSKTSAIVAVHLHGRPAQLSQLLRVAEDHGVPLLEDAAQAHGAEYLGKKVGTWGIAAAFSFYPTKNLGALGDAGCVVTDSNDIADRVRSLRSYGTTPDSKYKHLEPGWNSRLDPMQAAFLRIFLPQLDEWNSQRRHLAREYLEGLRSHSSVQPLDEDLEDGDSVWHHFVVRVSNREEFRNHLRSRGIGTDIHYPVPPFVSPAFAQLAVGGGFPIERFPVSLRLADEVVSLPMHPWLDPHIDEVVSQLLSYEHTP